MSRVCQITGKTAMIGNNVSHSKRRTKRKFDVNLFKKKYYLPEENRWVELTISAAGMRTINKNGIKNALKTAQEKGYIEKY
ncbi:MAG: 50S ribosomal protein L28 [Draconibacterium sp.]